MTALGKTLTIFVFLLSLVWCWLTVNAFTTRTNWKTKTAAAEAQVKAAVTRAEELDAALKSAAAANQALEKNILDASEANKKTIASLQTSIADLRSNLDKKTTAEKADENKTTLLEANLKAISDQLNQMKTRADAIEGKLTAAIRNEQDAKNEGLKQKLEADSLKSRNESIELQLAQLQDRFRDLSRGGSGIGNAPTVPVRSDIRGSITSISGDYITISLGADAGLAKGAVLDVSRLNATPAKYLGKVRLMSVTSKDAIGIFEPASGKATGENAPKVGDNILVL